VPPPPGKASSATTNVGRGRGAGAIAAKKTLLKPLHWVKVSRAVQGSLWADSQKQGSGSRYWFNIYIIGLNFSRSFSQ
jgi:formin 2